ncbi:hypothetical protein RFI_18986, partial [Reticulomyxa filosa]
MCELACEEMFNFSQERFFKKKLLASLKLLIFMLYSIFVNNVHGKANFFKKKTTKKKMRHKRTSTAPFQTTTISEFCDIRVKSVLWWLAGVVLITLLIQNFVTYPYLLRYFLESETPIVSNESIESNTRPLTSVVSSPNQSVSNTKTMEEAKEELEKETSMNKRWTGYPDSIRDLNLSSEDLYHMMSRKWHGFDPVDYQRMKKIIQSYAKFHSSIVRHDSQSSASTPLKGKYIILYPAAQMCNRLRAHMGAIHPLYHQIVKMCVDCAGIVTRRVVFIDISAENYAARLDGIFKNPGF